MRRDSFTYELPEELIAQYPTAERRASRLLQLDGNTGTLADGQFADVEQLLQAGDLLVLNNTKVLPARLLGRKASGGKVEVLVERLLDDQRLLAHVRASKAPKPGTELILEDALHAVMTQRHDALFELDFGDGPPLVERLQQHGHMPLPPYIERADESQDQERYQTVFAREPGAVAAPTAGLHFDEALLKALQTKGVEIAWVTLHVGAGTFQPLRAETLEEHQMHSEWLCVPQETVEAVQHCKQRKGRVVAVGTTAVRSLETAAASGELRTFAGDTQLFIYPGRAFNVVDALITNFHLSESTLLMLVSAFSGYQRIKKAYQHAIEQQYRFFSYGDAMWLTKNPNAIHDIPT